MVEGYADERDPLPEEPHFELSRSAPGQIGSVDTKIGFKAQVKNTGNGISGKELSRLASRVDDGEIGLFFTTSHYTRNAQEENLATYPVGLFSGGYLVKLLLQTDIVENNSLTDNVVDEIHEWD